MGHGTVFPWVLRQEQGQRPRQTQGCRAGERGKAIVSLVWAFCAAFHSVPRRWQGSFRNPQPAAASRRPAPREGWAGPPGAPAVPLLSPPSRLPKTLLFMVESFKMSFLFPQVSVGHIPENVSLALAKSPPVRVVHGTFVPGRCATVSLHGAEVDGTAKTSKPVTQLQRVIPELLIIDLFWFFLKVRKQVLDLDKQECERLILSLFFGDLLYLVVVLD